MPHVCEFCNKEFKQKNDLTRHNNKKNGCIQVEKVLEKKEIIESQNGKISELKSLFKSCLDILRNDAEHLVGDEALHELSLFLILKLSEKHILNNTVNIYDLNIYNKEMIAKYTETKFLENIEYIKFSKLTEYVKIPDKEANIKKIFDEFLWKEILSKHPKFKDVFEDGKKSNIKESLTFKKIILKLNEIDFNKYDHDILGEAYESIFVDAVFGAGQNKKSELGQFFTPTKVKKLMVGLVKPILKDNGKIETFLEPASGTGGILNTVIKHYKGYIKIGKITEEQLREQLINNMYGIEIKGKIYNLCLSNMLINTGEILPNVICSDSIRKYHNIKVDTICANPPFSVKIEWDELIKTLGSEDILNNYIPIHAGGANSEVLFLQMMIHCLNINGRCATVWLDGTKLYGKTSGYDTVREYLMKSCDLQQVILCPSGTFTSTGSKTCILFFIKKKERKDVVEIIGSGNKRNLKFISSHSTKKVKFYDYNPESADTHLITEVDIKDIELNNYSLNYSEYIKEVEEENKNDGIEFKELSELCEIEQGKNLTKSEMIDGIYTVIGGGKIIGTHNSKNRDGNDIIITRVGDLNINFIKTPYFLTDNALSIKSNNKSVLTMYIYYSLICMKDKIIKLYNGTAQKVIAKTNLYKLKIPLTSIEKQKQIIEFLDKLYEIKKIKIIDTVSYYENQNIFKLLLNGEYNVFEKLVEWHEQSVILEGHIQFFKDRVSRYLYLIARGENEMKTLKKISSINPESMKLGQFKEINYIDISSVKEGILSDVKNLTEDFPSRAKRVIKKGDILYSSVRPNLRGYTIINDNIINGIASTGFAQIRITEKDILPKYVYFMLTTEYITDVLVSKAKGAQYPAVSFGDFETLKIPIPSLEKQKEIIEYCESNNNLIKQLENEIEQNKIQANLFLYSIVKKVKIEQDELSDDESNSVKSDDSETNQNIINEDEVIEEDEVEVIEEVKPKKKTSKNKTMIV
jgi:type I restriction-modification system DNA methylase subunit